MGAWIEIESIREAIAYGASRTPRWVRGLKFVRVALYSLKKESHPTMGAWIEMLLECFISDITVLSHPTMGAWIEITLSNFCTPLSKCRTPRWVRGLKFCIAHLDTNRV